MYQMADTYIVSQTLNTLGYEAVAATTAAQKIDSLATKPIMAISAAMAAYTAQNYGADRLDRVWEGVQKVLKVTKIYSTVVDAVLIFFSQYFALLFVGPENTEILEMTRLYFITNSAFYVLLSSLIVHRYTLQGLARSTETTLAGLFELFGRVGAVLLLSQSFLQISQ